MRVAVEQEDVTVNVVMPRWYGLLSHEIMEHTAHHVHPLVPSYRLRAAQLQLRATLTHIVVEPFTLQYLRNVLRRCKLYDYERAQWTDFMGEPTARQHQTRASLNVRTV
jgi:omega-6 fatty acid desaturase (delta-12 desaturase)